MHCWARYLFIAVVIALGTLSMIGACGHRGPLYLPPPEPAADPADPAKGAKPATDVPQAPAGAGQPASGADLLAWPAGRPGGCTSGCPGGTGAQ